MVSCAVANCKNSSAKISKNKDGITFHRFPRDKERRKQWEVAVNREVDWASTLSSAVCSEHFVAADFYLTESGLRRLSIDAVPTINISPCQEPEPTISILQPVDIKSTDTDEVIQLKHKVRRLEAIAENRKKRLNLMWQSKRRLKSKLERMKCLIKHLIKIQKCSGDNGIAVTCSVAQDVKESQRNKDLLLSERGNWKVTKYVVERLCMSVNLGVTLEWDCLKQRLPIKFTPSMYYVTNGLLPRDSSQNKQGSKVLPI